MVPAIEILLHLMDNLAIFLPGKQSQHQISNLWSLLTIRV